MLEGEIKERARRPHPNTRGESWERRRYPRGLSQAVSKRLPSARQRAAGPGGRPRPGKGRAGPSDAGGGERPEGSACFGPRGLYKVPRIHQHGGVTGGHGRKQEVSAAPRRAPLSTLGISVEPPPDLRRPPPRSRAPPPPEPPPLALAWERR